jgi:hypothetical protein
MNSPRPTKLDRLRFGDRAEFVAEVRECARNGIQTMQRRFPLWTNRELRQWFLEMNKELSSKMPSDNKKEFCHSIMYYLADELLPVTRGDPTDPSSGSRAAP